MKALAIDLGGTMIKIALVNNDGTIESFREEPSNAKKGGPELIRTAMDIADSYSGYDCIGISTAGQVDTVTGTIRYANENIPNYTGTHVAAIFEERFNKPVLVENDVNSAALGEARFGAAKACPHFLCLTYGTGVGGGIVIDGKVYHGADGVAGELGHIIVHPDGKLCGCGRHGCYEQYASTTALVAAAKLKDPSIENGRQLFEKLDELHEVVDAWIKEVALGLVSLVHVFNPHAIVLGGGVMSQPYILKGLNEYFYPQLIESYRGVRLVCAEKGNMAGLLGAASLHFMR